LPLGEKEYINSPYLIAFWECRMTMNDDARQLVDYGDSHIPGYRIPNQRYYLTYRLPSWVIFGDVTWFVCIYDHSSPLVPDRHLPGHHHPLQLVKPIIAQYGPNKLIYYLIRSDDCLPNIFQIHLVLWLVAITRMLK